MTKLIQVGDQVTWGADGSQRTAAVLRVEVINSRIGPKRCLCVRIPADKSARAYRFIDEQKVTHVNKQPTTAADRPGIVAGA